MGQIHDLHCSKCGYGIKVWMGIGLMYSQQAVFTGENPSLIHLVNDEEISTKALDLLHSGEKAADNYGHALYACPNDFYLFERFYFKIGNMEPQYPCPYCDKTLEQVTFAKGDLGVTRLQFIKSQQYWQCPKCGNDSMKESFYADWD